MKTDLHNNKDFLGGLLMIQSSVSGEYLWRALSEARNAV